MLSLILFILILGAIVAVHEFGHFIVAKISGMYVTTFSIGMGPKIASFQKGETEYVISVIPAGGFVSVKGISGDPDEDNDPDDPRLFQNRPIIHRMLFTLAGPFMNFLTALAALLIFYLALGVNVADNDSPPIIAEVTADSAAASAGWRRWKTRISPACACSRSGAICRYRKTASRPMATRRSCRTDFCMIP